MYFILAQITICIKSLTLWRYLFRSSHFHEYLSSSLTVYHSSIHRKSYPSKALFQVQSLAMRLAISSRLGSQSELQRLCLGTQNSELRTVVAHTPRCTATRPMGRVLIMRDINWSSDKSRRWDKRIELTRLEWGILSDSL